jgi:hypothetical protein
MADQPAPGFALRGHPLLRRGGGWALVGVVSVVHLLAVNQVATETLGWGDRERTVPRIEVAFVRELQQAAPPSVAPAPAPAPKADRALPLVAQRPKAAASAPAAASASEPTPADPVIAPEPTPTDPVVAAAPAPPPPPAMPDPAPAPPSPAPPPTSPSTPTLEPPPAAVAEPAPPSAVATADPASAPAAPVSASATPAHTFDWPPSTRLSYLLQGDVNGPVDGTALVEWLRSGQRYQVRFEVNAASFFSRRSVSDGELTPRGLEPRQFQGEQRVMFKTRRWSQQFHPERITLSDGPEQPTAPGVQDEASQFVQLTWLFTTQPSLLQVGRSIEVPLMINRRLDRWIYDVIEQETLRLSFGEVPTFHVKPRRVRTGALAVEMWFAPSLQYLPVRIMVRQNETHHMDLTLKTPPLQAAADPATR